VTELDQTLGSLDRQLCHRRVVTRRTVERRSDDLALHGALHLGDLFWPLVDQHHHQVTLRVVRRDRVRDRLHDERLAGLGGRHDQTTLTLAYRGDDVDQSRCQQTGLRLESQPIGGIQRRELGEVKTML
jgi:hypothetical protein